MAKTNEPALTYCEILSYAIRMAYVDWREVEDRAEIAEAFNQKLADEIRNSSTTKSKLESLLQLYKMETGTEYGIDV